MKEVGTPRPERVKGITHEEFAEVRQPEIWKELKQNPPDLVAILSDSVQYVFYKDGGVSFEPSDTGQDRINAAGKIFNEFPNSQILTLSTSFDNYVEDLPDCLLYQNGLLEKVNKYPEFILPESRSFDTFTELMKVARIANSKYWGEPQNIAIITNIKQTERVRVQLDTLRYSGINNNERKRFEHYFDKAVIHRPEMRLPKRLEAFGHFKELAYNEVFPNAYKLKNKNFMIIPSEDITGENLDTEQDHDTNLQGVQDWLDRHYGQKYYGKGLMTRIFERLTKPQRDPKIMWRNAETDPREQRSRIILMPSEEAKNDGGINLFLLDKSLA